MRSVSSRASLLLGLGLVLACDRYHYREPAGTAGTAGAAGETGAGSGGAAGGGAGGQGAVAGGAGSSGDAGATQTSGGSGGAGGSQNIPEVCPDDGSDTAQLTLVGLGISLPGTGAPLADAGGDAGAGLDGGAGLQGSPDASAPSVVLPGLLGWASVPGLGSTTTLGGAAGRVVTASTAEELQAYAGSDEPLVIRVCGTIRAPSVQVSSNKTIVGVGAQATLEGGLRIRGTRDVFIRDVVVKNLRVNGAQSAVDGAAIQIYNAHHVWIDHSELYDSVDGSIQVIHGSDFVSVSWTKFHFTPATPDPEHRFACLIGDSDAEAARLEDEGHLRVTLHHNWWANDIRQRAPRVRFGDVHLFENYYSSTGNDWSIWAALGSRLRLEHNYFDHVSSPHELHDSDAKILAIDNVYDGTSGVIASNGMAFTPPYEYSLGPASAVPGLVVAGAGRQ